MSRARRTFSNRRSLLGPPFDEKSKFGGVAHDGVAGAGGEEPGDGGTFGDVEWIVDADDFVGKVAATVASLVTQTVRAGTQVIDAFQPRS